MTHSLLGRDAIALSIVEELAVKGYCLTTAPLRLLSTLASVTIEVPISTRAGIRTFIMI